MMNNSSQAVRTLCCAMLIPMICHAEPEPTPASEPLPPLQVSIAVDIDGMDFLKVHRNEFWLEHLMYRRPGQKVDEGGPALTVDGVVQEIVWLKERPQASKPITTRVYLPQGTTGGVKIVKKRGRGHVSIWDQPNEKNGYTLTLKFDDLRPNGSQIYHVDIHFRSIRPQYRTGSETSSPNN